MAIPKIMHPQFDISIPSLGKKMKFRQFLVKEEKILLVAKASSDDADMLTAIKQVVQNCSLDNSFNADEIAAFDLEYIFLKLRSISVNSIIKLSYRDFEDNKVYDFEVDLEKIEMNVPKNTTGKIPITDKTGVVIKYPNASVYSDKNFLSLSAEDAAIQLVVRSIDKIYDDTAVYDAKSISTDELVDYVENLDIKTFEKINEFLSTAPKLRHEIKYKNSLGHERVIMLESLNDFFQLR